MIVTTIGRVREHDPDATFVLLNLLPGARSRAGPRSGRHSGRCPKATVVAWSGAFVARIAGLVGLAAARTRAPVAGATRASVPGAFDVTASHSTMEG